DPGRASPRRGKDPMIAEAWQSIRRHFDWTLLGLIFLVAGLGLVNLYSCTRHPPVAGLFVQQLIWLTLGFGLYLALSLVDYRMWHRFAWLAVILGVLAVAGTHLGGVTAKGAQRWIGLGPVRFQPSEFIKITLILAASRLIHDRA